MEALLFFREVDGEEQFYVVDVPKKTLRGRSLKQVAREQAELNPGTLRVQSVVGKVLWRAQNMH